MGGGSSVGGGTHHRVDTRAWHLCLPSASPDPHRKLFLAQPPQDWDNAEPASVQDFRVQTSLSESPTRINLGCVVLNILLSFSEL